MKYICNNYINITVCVSGIHPKAWTAKSSGGTTIKDYSTIFAYANERSWSRQHDLATRYILARQTAHTPQINTGSIIDHIDKIECDSTYAHDANSLRRPL